LCREELAKKVNSGVFPYMQGGPFMHQILAKAVAFGEALQPAFKEYARQVVRNARDLSTQLQARGFSIVSGGTDNHLFVLDFRKSDLTGKRAQEALESVGLVTNKNLVPFDTRNSVHTSGLRVGTPSATTRGMKTEEMKLIADWIAERLAAPDDPETEGTIASQVRALTRDFPIPAAVLPVPA